MNTLPPSPKGVVVDDSEEARRRTRACEEGLVVHAASSPVTSGVKVYRKKVDPVKP